MLYKYKYFWNCTRDIVIFTDSDFSKRASKRGSKYGCCAAVLYKLFLTLRYEIYRRDVFECTDEKWTGV